MIRMHIVNICFLLCPVEAHIYIIIPEKRTYHLKLELYMAVVFL